MIYALRTSSGSLWTRAVPYLAGGGIATIAAAALLRKEPDLQRGLLGLAYLGLLAWIAVHDTRTMRAPNRVVYPALAFAIAASISLGWSAAGEALLGGVVAFLTLLAVAVIGRGALGFGDVKVAALCGIVVGLHGVFPMVVLALIGAGLLAAVALGLGIRDRSDSFAFTPLLGAATAVCMLLYPLYLW